MSQKTALLIGVLFLCIMGSYSAYSVSAKESRTPSNAFVIIVDAAMINSALSVQRKLAESNVDEDVLITYAEDAIASYIRNTLTDKGVKIKSVVSLRPICNYKK